MITLLIHNALKKNSSKKTGMDKILINYKQDLKIQEIVEKFELEELGLVVVNGKIKPYDYQINDGDTVELHPMFGGG